MSHIKRTTCKQINKKLSDRELEKLKARQQKYINALDDLAQLRDHYKKQLHQKLEQKVKDQHARFKQRDKEIEMKSAFLENQKRTSSAKSKPEYREHANENLDFMESTQTTNIHRMLRIQNSLERQGQLKYRSDKDELWSILLQNENLSIVESHLSNDPNVTLRGIRKLLRTSAEEAASPETTKDPDAANVHSASGKGKVAFQKINKSDQQREKIEKFPPMVQRPKFQVLFKTPTNDNIDNEEETKSKALELKRNRRIRRQRQVKQMFKHSTVYKMATERLMKKHSLGAFNSTWEAIDIGSPDEDRSCVSVARSMPTLNLEKTVESKEESELFPSDFRWKLNKEPDELPDEPEDSLQAQQTCHHENRIGKVLSIEAVQESSVIRLSKGISSMWSNPDK